MSEFIDDKSDNKKKGKERIISRQNTYLFNIVVTFDESIGLFSLGDVESIEVLFVIYVLEENKKKT